MKTILVPGSTMCLRFVGMCFSVLSVAGLTNVQAVQQNTIDFSKAVPNAQGLYFLYKKISRGDLNTNPLHMI